MRLQRLGSVLRLLLAAAILGYSAWQLESAGATVEWSELTLRPAPLSLAMLSGAAALILLAQISALGARLAGLGAPGAGFYLGWTRVWFQSYFFRYVPGKIALVVERARLGERLGVSRASSLVLVLWESLLLMAGAALLGGVGVLLASTSDPNEQSPISGPAVLGLAALFLFLSIAMWPLLGAIVRRSPALAKRLPGLILDVPAAGQALLVIGNAAAWGLLGLSFAATARALSGAELPGVIALGTWFVASYAGGQIASVAPAGLGVREAILVAALSTSVPAPTVLAWAVAHRIALSLAEIVLVGLSLLVPLPESGDTLARLDPER